MVSRSRRSQPDATDTIDVDSLPLPMRRAYLRCREADGPQHRPKGDGAHLYARVSDEEQAGPGKTSIGEQLRQSEKALAGTAIPIIARWSDLGFSGASRLCDRPIGRELVAALKPGQIVVVYRLDRFSRNTLLGLDDINELRQRGWDCSSPASSAGSRPPAANSIRFPSSTSSKGSSPHSWNAI
jgi:Resolvase, N terminal domain